ncbi:MAG: LysM peptidoglycan-binding domain-containing protein [Chloroflexota bacterium]
MKANFSSVLAVISLAAMFILVGCEIPSPNAPELVPVDTNPITVPSEPQTENPEGDAAQEGGGEAEPAPAEGEAGAGETGEQPADQAAEGESGDTPTQDTQPAENAAEQPAQDAAVEESPRPEDQPADQSNDVVEAPAVEAPPENGVYVIQAGDTLGQIAERFGITTDELAAANGITNINAIDVGQEIRIPAPGEAAPPAETAEEAAPSQGEIVYVVTAGDTLFSIARRYGFSVDEIQQYNGIADPTRIDVGQQIRIPAR